MSGRRPARVALAVWVAAGAARGVIGDQETLIDAQQVIADRRSAPRINRGPIVTSLRVGHGAETAASHLALRVRGD